MTAVWVRARAELRQRWRASVLLTMVVGLAGGVVLAAVAGARRTDSAMDRFLAYNRPLNVAVEAEDLDLRAVQRLPQVADTGIGAYMAMAPSTASGAPDPALGSVNPWVAVGGRVGRTSERPLVVAGHLPDPDRPLEAAVDETLAARRRVAPGGTLRMWAFTPRQAERVLSGLTAAAPKGPAFDFTVTGVVRYPQDLSPVAIDQDVVYLGSDDLYLTPAFWRAYGTTVGNFGMGQQFRLHHGDRDLQAFTAAVRGLPGGRRAVVLVGSDAERAAARAQRAIHVQAIALLAFAVLAGVAGLLVVGQSIARQVQLEVAESPTLVALGMTHWQLAAVALARATLVGTGGALLAAALAVLASPLAPIGLARQAEVDPGWSVDLPVLALGALAVLGGVLIRAGLTAWWLARPAAGAGAREPVPRRPSQVAERLARAGASPSTVTGVRLAFEPGQAGSGMAARTAVVGAVVAVMAVTASLTFAASLDRLVRTPALQGWNWEVVVGNYHDAQDITPRSKLLARNQLVSGYSSVAQAVAPVTIGGLAVPVVAVNTIKGSVQPQVLEGREARSADELALGRETLRRLGRALGDLVEVQGADRPRRMRIVGAALLPAYSGDMTLNQGAIVTLGGLRALVPGSIPNQFLVQYAPGANQAAAFGSLRRDFGRTVLRALPPEEVENLRRVRGLPFALAALLAVLGVATLGHLLVTSVRRRRRDLAVLKTMGFVRAQVSATVAWQATTLAAVALLAGLPLGIAAGRWAWMLVNQGLGSLANPITPTVPLLLAVPAVVLVANLVAAVPARAAAATRPAVVLRSE